ncbi:MAG: TPM domain-containing protein [Leptospiraceae bacterium]|nr:TPM domain-containing protein [Leptospiraceae bacterium]MCZ8347020.1 TPM domain-containing protein [Leptospiraceae bacterium]
MMKLILSCIFLLFTDFLAAKEIPVFATRVVDEAQILNLETKEALESLSQDLENRTSAQLILYTTPSLEGEVLEEYSLRVAESNGVGQAKKDNGILVLIVTEDRKMRIEVGYGLEDTLTDIYCNRIIRNIFIPNFKLGDYNKGILDGMKAIQQILDGEADKNPNLSSDEIISEASIASKASQLDRWNKVGEESFFQFLILFGILLIYFLVTKLLNKTFPWIANKSFRFLFGFTSLCLGLFFGPRGFILIPFFIFIVLFFYSLIYIPDNQKPILKKLSKKLFPYLVIVLAHLILFFGFNILDNDLMMEDYLWIVISLFLFTLIFRLSLDNYIQNTYESIFKKLGFEDRSFAATQKYFYSFILFCSFLVLILSGFPIISALYLYILIGLAIYVGFWVKTGKYLIYFALVYSIFIISFLVFFYKKFNIINEANDLTIFTLNDALTYYSIFHIYASTMIVIRFIESKNHFSRLLKFGFLALLWTIIPYLYTLLSYGEWPSLMVFPLNLASVYFFRFLKFLADSDSGGYSSGGGGSSYSSSSSYRSSSSSSSSSGSSYRSGGGSFGGGGSSGSW